MSCAEHRLRQFRPSASVDQKIFISGVDSTSASRTDDNASFSFPIPRRFVVGRVQYLTGEFVLETAISRRSGAMGVAYPHTCSGRDGILGICPPLPIAIIKCFVSNDEGFPCRRIRRVQDCLSWSQEPDSRDVDSHIFCCRSQVWTTPRTMLSQMTYDAELVDPPLVFLLQMMSVQQVRIIWCERPFEWEVRFCPEVPSEAGNQTSQSCYG